MGLLHAVAVRTLPLVPTPMMRRLASPYIAGEELADALGRLRSLRDRGFTGILDILGEGITGEAEARSVAEAYKAAADRVHAEGLDTYVSIKPTHLGLTSSEGLCAELYADVAAHCRALGLFVRVEMEDHPTTDGTLRVFSGLRSRYPNVGIVLQSRLFRTPRDIDALDPDGLDVRLVKGIYIEPGEIAHTEYAPIRQAFLACARQLFEGGARVGLATHDEPMAEELFALVRELEVPRERYELQVLLGVQEPLWTRWREAGHPVRVYVPYGPDWRAYSLRRLRRNPQMFEHVVRATLRGLTGRS